MNRYTVVGFRKGVRMHGHWFERFTLLLWFALWSLSTTGQESVKPFVPKSLYPAPDVKRDVVLRIERFPTCKNCPWYEIRILDDSTDMYIGKDAVRELGVRGTYINTPKVTSPGVRPGEGVERALKRIDEVHIQLRDMWGALEAMQRRRPPNDDAAQLIEIESSSKHRGRLRFYLLPSGDEAVNSLLTNIENLSWLRRAEPFALSPRPPFFSDRNAAIYLRYQIFPPEECARADDADDLIIVLYADGRMYTEQIRALGPKVAAESDISKISINVGTEEVARMQSLLLSHGNELTATQLESVPNARLSPSMPPGLWQVRDKSRLYLKDRKGDVHDFSAALVLMSQPVAKGSEAVRNALLDIAQTARQKLPAADPNAVARCRNLPPRR